MDWLIDWSASWILVNQYLHLLPTFLSSYSGCLQFSTIARMRASVNDRITQSVSQSIKTINQSNQHIRWACRRLTCPTYDCPPALCWPRRNRGRIRRTVPCVTFTPVSVGTVVVHLLTKHIYARLNTIDYYYHSRELSTRHTHTHTHIHTHPMGAVHIAVRLRLFHASRHCLP